MESKPSSTRALFGWALVAGVVLVACGDDGPEVSSDDATSASSGGGAAVSTTTATSTTHGSSGSGPAATGATTGAGGEGGQPVTFEDVYPLTAEFPEGGAYDADDGAFFVGSLADGSVHRVDASSGDDETIFTETAEGAWWTLGMDVDLVRRRLWVCAMDDRSPDPRAGFVWIFDLDAGARVRSFPLDVAADDATCTDIGVTADGVGYVGDREQGNVYRVDFDAGPTLFTSSPDLESSVIGQNAMVVLPDQSALISLLYLPSGLARIDLQSGEVTPIDIDGPFSDSDFLGGADGMTYSNGKIYVAFTSRLARVTPTLGDWSAVSTVDEAVPSGMTDVLSTPGGLYLLNGQSVRFAIGLTPDPFRLVRYTGAL